MKKMSRATLITTFYLLATGLAGATEKIDINTAPLADLVKIIHIGETRAQELISLRPFSSLDDLDRIKGIGPKRIEDVKKQGLAWVVPPVEVPQPESLKVKAKEASPPPVEEKPRTSEPQTNNELAAVNEQIANPASLFVFLIAGALAVSSGAIILFLKKRAD